MSHNRWLFTLRGIAVILFGILAKVWPGAMVILLLHLMVTWAILAGIPEILATIEFRRGVSDEWPYILSGIVSVILGVLASFFPGAGASSIIWLIGVYVIVFGLLLIIPSQKIKIPAV